MKIQKKLLVSGLSLVLFTLMTFVSCGGTNILNTDDNSGSDDPGYNEPDDESGSEGADLNYRLPEEYRITYQFTDEEGDITSETYMKTKKGLMFDDTIFYKYNNSLMGLFEYDKDEDTVSLDSLVSDSSMIEIYELLFTGWLGFYDSYKEYDEFKKAGKEKIAGRDCTKYEYRFDYYGVSATQAFWVEDEYEICMKYYIDYSDSTGSGAITFEVTEFETSGLSLPCSDDDYKSQIDDSLVEIREVYVGSWSEVSMDNDTYEYVPVPGGKKVIITDDLKMKYDGKEYELSILGSFLVVKENDNFKYTLMGNDDLLVIDGLIFSRD